MEVDLTTKSCINQNCKDYGNAGLGNIGTRGTYAKDKRPLLYCKTCGKRFGMTRGTAMFGIKTSLDQVSSIVHHAAEGMGIRATARVLDMDKNTVNRVVLHAGDHCANVMRTLLQSLGMTEVQLDELWTFVKKKAIPAKSMENVGYGRRSKLKRGC